MFKISLEVYIAGYPIEIDQVGMVLQVDSIVS